MRKEIFFKQKKSCPLPSWTGNKNETSMGQIGMIAEPDTAKKVDRNATSSPSPPLLAFSGDDTVVPDLEPASLHSHLHNLSHPVDFSYLSFLLSLYFPYYRVISPNLPLRPLAEISNWNSPFSHHSLCKPSFILFVSTLFYQLE
jgi:hypothetical protein